MRGSRAFAVNRKPAEGQAQPAWREATALPSTVRPPNAKRIPRTRPPCGLKAADDHQITRPERMTFMAEPVSDLETAASLCASYNDHGAACVVPLKKWKVRGVVDWLEAEWQRFAGADFAS